MDLFGIEGELIIEDERIGRSGEFYNMTKIVLRSLLQIPLMFSYFHSVGVEGGYLLRNGNCFWWLFYGHIYIYKVYILKKT